MVFRQCAFVQIQESRVDGTDGRQLCEHKGEARISLRVQEQELVSGLSESGVLERRTSALARCVGIRSARNEAEDLLKVFEIHVRPGDGDLSPDRPCFVRRGNFFPLQRLRGC